MGKIKKEEGFYKELLKMYASKDNREKETMLTRNFKRVNTEVDNMIAELLGDNSNNLK